MLTPPSLKPGDRVLILSAARKMMPEELTAAIDLLKSWGLEVELGESIGAEENQFAGTDALRLRDLQRGLDREDVAALLFARGGYGCLRIMDSLRWDGFMKHPKWVCGYSDYTVLHAWMNSFLGVKSLHCSMPISFAQNTQEAINSIRKAWFGEEISYQLPSHPLNQTGSSRARLVGGNLSLLYALGGSSTQLQTDHCILFLEDLDEYYYHIDRMMQNLKRSGKLKNIRGMVVGQYAKAKDNDIPFGKNFEQIISEYVKEYAIPVAFGFPAGHIDDNRALILNAEVDFKVEQESVSLRFI